MAITGTTLTADLSASELTMSVTSGSGFPAVGAAPQQNYLVRIDNEYMYAVSQPAALTITLRQRGAQGSAATAHDKLAKVLVSATPSDFSGVAATQAAPFPIQQAVQQTIGEDITFSSADVAGWSQDRNFVITKASAAAIVLVAPSKAQDGLKITFTSDTDATHAITATSLLANAGASSPYTTATWANAKAGGGITLQAQNGLWNETSAINVTLS